MGDMASILRVAEQISSGDTSACAVVQQTLGRIDAQSSLHAFTTVFREVALEEARARDAAQAAGAKLGLLHGVPLAVKDNMDVAGVPTTCGVRNRRSEIPTHDAQVVASLRAAGAIIIGKTNMDPFAWGGTGVNEDFGTVVNPHHSTSFAAGSSAGSAVAVAADLVPGSLGSDTGGSVRLPASVNGVVGLRPTVGRISTQGVVPLAKTFDAIGPITATVDDCAALYEVLSGDAPSEQPQRPRVGITAWFLEDLEHDVEHALSAVVDGLLDDGFDVATLQADWLAAYFDAWMTIHLVEPAQVFRDELAAHPETFPNHVQELLELGAKHSQEEYQAALQQRFEFIDRCTDLFAEVDVLLCPTLPFDAIDPGALTVELGGKHAPIFEAIPKYTYVASMAGLPAISVPAAKSTRGVPIGVQFIAPWNAEHSLFPLARYAERLNELGAVRV